MRNSSEIAYKKVLQMSALLVCSMLHQRLAFKTWYTGTTREETEQVFNCQLILLGGQDKEVRYSANLKG